MIGLPYAWGDVSGNVGEDARTISRSGLGDPRLRFSYLLLGGAARSARELATAARGPTLGASLSVSAPLGQYDPSKLINIGTNRWAFKPEIGFAYPVGPWQFDAYAALWFFTDNTNFFGGSRREQDLITSYQAHVSYTIRPGLWAALNATYYTGGSTSIDGLQKDDRQSNTRLGFTLSAPLAPGLALKFNYSDGAVTRIGGDYRSMSLALQYAWLD